MVRLARRKPRRRDGQVLLVAALWLLGAGLAVGADVPSEPPTVPSLPTLPTSALSAPTDEVVVEAYRRHELHLQMRAHGE